MHCDADFDAPIDASEYAGSGATTDQTAGADDWGGSDQDSLEDDGDWGDSDAAVTEHASGWDEGGPGDAGHTDGWSPEDEATTSTTGDSTASESTTSDSTTGADPTPASVSDYGTTGGASEDAGSASTGDVADPEAGGTGRNLLQSVARIGAVLLVVVVGLVTTGTLVILTGESPGLWIAVLAVGLLAIVTGGIVVARQDTGIDALADALYVTAAAVVGLPLVFFVLLPTDQSLTGRLFLGFVGAFMGAFVGVPAFVLGYFLQPDDE
jgi:hypothetical protein